MPDRHADTVIRARHAAFAAAVRRGDVLEAARAGARLRLGGAPITARELTAARRARMAIGRALVRARWLRPSEELAAHPIPGKATPTQVVRTLPAPRRPLRQVLAAAALVVVALLLLRPGGGFFGGGPGGPAPNPTSVPGATSADHLFGRTVSLASPVGASATPPPPTTPRPSGTNTTNTPPGGAGSGAPAPGGGGALPTPNPKPSLPGLDYGRLTVIVTDSIAHQAISGVCVALGAASCDQSARTDQNGRASQDIKLPARETQWDITLVRAGYAQTAAHTIMIQGEEVIVRVELTPQR